jgi:hypothetical protein
MNSHLNRCSIWVLLFFISNSLIVFSQNIWLEDFQSYADDSGYTGTGATGDYPSLVSKWSLDISGAELANSNNWFMVNKLYSDYHLETKNTKGECVWTSESISIANYFDVQIQVSCSEVGTLESDDYIKLYYSIDGASETPFSSNGIVTDDFTSLTASQNFLSGSTLQIVIKTNTNSASEKIRFDDITVSGVSTSASLMFTEIADPSDDNNARFVELKNVSSSSIDFDVNTYYISRQIDGASWEDFQLTGSLCSGCIKTVGYNSSNFSSAYGISPDYTSTIINGDGNDTYVLFSGGDHSSGTCVDICGQIGQDGTEQNWNYEDGRAVRGSRVGGGATTWDTSEWTISSAVISNMTPGALENEYRFYNSIWHPDLSVPTISSDAMNVVIQSGSVTISTSFDCSNLSVYLSASLELSQGKGITIVEAIRNNGLLKLKSDSICSASIIANGDYSFNLQYDLFVSGGASAPWHLISSPVKNQSINDFVTTSDNNIQTSNTTQNYALAVFNTSTDLWNYYHNGLGTSPNISAAVAGDFVMANGYSMLRSTSGDVSFIGEYITESQVITLSANKWNLVGNPYPNFINVNSLVDANDNIISLNTGSLNDAYEAIYLWDATAEEYKVINQISSATYLNPGQGFYVLADSDGGDFSFNETMQSHQSGDWFERPADGNPQLKLIAEFSDKTSYCEIVFVDGLTSGLDIGFDAGRFSSRENEKYIVSQLIDGSLDSLELGLQCLPSLEEMENEYLPIGVFTNEYSILNFKIEKENFPENKMILIRDLLQETQTRLDVEGSYYTCTIDNSEPMFGRFQLYIPNELVQIEEREIEASQFYCTSINQVLTIHCSEEGEAVLRLFDLSGRLMHSNNLIMEKRKSLSLQRFAKGIYIIELQLENGMIFNDKVFL